MKIQKYPQSHLIISDEQTKIMIDPGSITFSKGYKPQEFQGADAYLITHQHEDHVDSNNIKEVVLGKPVYGNRDVVEKLKGLGIEVKVVVNRQKFRVGSFEIEAIDLPHCKMQDGSDGPPNTGFLINGVFFHPGDGDNLPAGRQETQITSENVALPIAGPSITMEGALEFAKDLKAKVVIPIHYDFFTNDPNDFAKMAKEFGIEVRSLAPGEETTI